MARGQVGNETLLKKKRLEKVEEDSRRCPECGRVGYTTYITKTISGKRSQRKLWGIKYCEDCGIMYPVDEEPEDD